MIEHICVKTYYEAKSFNENKQCVYVTRLQGKASIANDEKKHCAGECRSLWKKHCMWIT